eukprot:gnl/TRDRNA2_/TRDRNA2_165558_c1_seq4.p1 gnl/TRDRNA2_/TRDRNA2_165558_c1~~gnl/TRDRNA2_/TRDRNA2_165558_c1_seq4.p1  ORF type:complete len:174 (+),score=10.36 gnl/TRDRNA2_/TRDRNA2_165558_c1_seq4:160-681(+)
MWATAFMIRDLGCSNVHIRCEATDVNYVLMAYGLGSSSVPNYVWENAKSCVKRKCPVGDVDSLNKAFYSEEAGQTSSEQGGLGGAAAMRRATIEVPGQASWLPGVGGQANWAHYRAASRGQRGAWRVHRQAPMFKLLEETTASITVIVVPATALLFAVMAGCRRAGGQPLLKT